MHNQSGITRNSYSYSSWQSTSENLFPKPIAKYFRIKESPHCLKSISLNILTLLTVGTLLMGGIYFFLVQLANHGW